MAILSHGFPQVKFISKPVYFIFFWILLLYLTTHIFWVGYIQQEIFSPSSVFSAFIYLCVDLGCSWGFHTAECTSECTPLCIFNVEIPQWSKQNFPLSPSFQRYSQDTFNASCSTKQELLSFLLHNLRKCLHNPKTSFSAVLTLHGGIFFTGYVPCAPRHFACSYCNKDSSFPMLVMTLEGKYILTSILHEDKVDIFPENSRKT